MQGSSIISSERLDNVLLFHKIDGPLAKSERKGPKGYETFRYIASAEIIDLEGEIISLEAIAEVKPIMIKQGARTQYNHMNFPTGYFFDWGFTKTEGIDAIWIDVEVYDDYPNQKDILRRIKLHPEDPESLTCISLGGFKLEKERECGDLTCWTRITKIEGWEYSHVHRGANQLALKIEEQLDYMEFESLSKEQPRDSGGRFAPISETVTTTITKYDTSNFGKETPCNKKVNKMDKPKPKEEEEYSEDKNLEGEQELEEEVVEQAEEEQAEEDLTGEEEFNEEPMMEEGLEDPMDQIADRELLVDTNERIKVIMAAMNIDKSDEAAFIEEYKTLEDKYLIKNQGEEEMTDKEITVNGNVYVLKTDNDKPEIDKSEPEKTVTEPLTEEKIEAMFDEKLKKFGETLIKNASVEEEEVADNTQNPAAHDESQAPIVDGTFNKGMSEFDRFMEIGKLSKADDLTVFN